MTDRYFDHHTTQPLHASARRVLETALDRFGDPLRSHERGRSAHRMLEDSREAVADAIGAQPDEIVFTSGGTEAISLALLGVVRSEPEGRILVGAVEHPAVLGAAGAMAGRGNEIALVPVDELGRIDVDRFAEEVRSPQTRIAAVQHANHEVATMQPVAETAMLAREAGVLFHMDARQTASRLPIDVDALGVDLLSMSGHTIGGGPGAGALYVRHGVQISPLFMGDDRERRRRAGMQHVPAIAAMAAVLRAAIDDVGDAAARDWSLTTRLRRGLEQIEGVRLHGHATQRTPHLVCFSADEVEAEALLMALDERGFRLDGGSVTSRNLHEPSPVLAAMGVPDTVGIRASVGPGIGDQDVDQLVVAVGELVAAT